MDLSLDLDLLSIFSQLFNQLLPFLPTWAIDAVEVVCLIGTVIVAVWAANKPVIARFLPNAVTSDRFTLVDGVVEELEKTLGTITPNVRKDLSNPATVAKLIVEDSATDLIKDLIGG